MTDRINQIRGLLIEQYKESPNLNGLINSFSVQLQNIDDEYLNLLTKRGLETAEGANLDIIGRIVVLDRPFTDPDPEEVFTFDGPVGGGFTDEGNTQQGGYYIGLNPINNQRYSDSAYRFMLRAKIIYNTTNATLADMHAYAKFVFDAEAVILERVGAVDIHISRPIGRQEQFILQQTFPRAAGINLGDVIFSVESGAFGFDGDSRNGTMGDLLNLSLGGVFSALIID